jgi:multidrug efflux pump subunit AcrA (membrane-fusion protein)
MKWFHLYSFTPSARLPNPNPNANLVSAAHLRRHGTAQDALREEMLERLDTVAAIEDRMALLETAVSAERARNEQLVNELDNVTDNLERSRAESSISKEELKKMRKEYVAMQEDLTRLQKGNAGAELEEFNRLKTANAEMEVQLEHLTTEVETLQRENMQLISLDAHEALQAELTEAQVTSPPGLTHGRVWQATSNGDPRQQQDWVLKCLQGKPTLSRPMRVRRSALHPRTGNPRTLSPGTKTQEQVSVMREMMGDAANTVTDGPAVPLTPRPDFASLHFRDMQLEESSTRDIVRALRDRMRVRAPPPSSTLGPHPTPALLREREQTWSRVHTR